MNKIIIVLVSISLLGNTNVFAHKRSHLRTQKQPVQKRRYRSALRKPNTHRKPTYDLHHLLAAIDTEHVSVAIERVTKINDLFEALDAKTATQALEHWQTIDTNMKQTITKAAHSAELTIAKNEPIPKTMERIIAAIEQLKRERQAAQKQVAQLTRQTKQLTKTLDTIKAHAQAQQELLANIPTT